MFFGLICRFPKFFGLLKLVRNSPTGLKTCPKQSDSDYFGFLFILKLINFQSESVRISPNNFFSDSESIFSDSEKNIFSCFSESETIRNCPKLSDRIRSDPTGLRVRKVFLVRRSPTESDRISFFIFGLYEKFSDSKINFRTP